MLLFESDELEKTEDFLSTHYAPMRIGSGSEKSTTRMTRAAAPEVTVDRLDIGFEMSYDVQPLGVICLVDVEAGAFHDHGPEHAASEDFGTGDLFSLAPPDRAYAGTVDHARYTLTLIDPAVLTHVASPARGHDTVELLDHRPFDAHAAARLRGAIAHVEEAVLADPEVAGSALVRGAAVRYLAAQVLAAFPNSSSVASAADERDAHPPALRRAIDFIEANADREITPAQIAAAANVSIRSVQLAFSKHLGTTPTSFLRSVRLARVRRALTAAQPGDGTTVADVALRWGFAHQGRFGQAYRQVYGETPGTTMRRVR